MLRRARESPKETVIWCDNARLRLADFFSNRWPLKALRLIKFPFTVLRNLFLAECRVFNLPITPKLLLIVEYCRCIYYNQ